MDLLCADFTLCRGDFRRCNYFLLWEWRYLAAISTDWSRRSLWIHLVDNRNYNRCTARLIIKDVTDIIFKFFFNQIKVDLATNAKASCYFLLKILADKPH